MEKILITGSTGFVGKHFVEYLERNRRPCQVLGLDMKPESDDGIKHQFVQIQTCDVDLLNYEKLEVLICEFQPNKILHLASYSSVGFSWANPILSFNNNMNIFLNILEIVRKNKIKCRVLSIGSSEEYGCVEKNDLPLSESHSLNPTSPYAVARVSQELCSKVYCDGYGIDIIMTRSFNHIGPRQRDAFVVASFAKQLVGVKKNKCLNAKINTGNIDVVRDFLDVRDVVTAYDTLLQEGRAGEIYNVCSSEGISLREILRILIDIINVKVEIIQDPSLFRPNENPIIVGSNAKISSELGWAKSIPLRRSLEDVVEYWEQVLYE